MLKTACSTLALLAFNVSLAAPALAANCATPADTAALKTAVMQQELMVAALQCHEAGAYNRFVMTYRGELQASDATLKAFFVRRGGEHGEAGYDTFKTKAANLSALEQARDAGTFCADAHALFSAALSNQSNLMSFVNARATDIGNVCVESHPTPVTAWADTKPEKAPAMMKVAQARSADVGGVPAHSLPAMPYQREDLAPPPVQSYQREDEAPPPVASYEREDRARPARIAARFRGSETARDEEEEVRSSYADSDEDVAPPPPRPRYYQVRNRSYQDDYYAPRSYGPPADWRQQQQYSAPSRSYGWYPRDGYYYGR